MKKLITIGLALVLMLALAVPALAQVEPAEVTEVLYPGESITVDKTVEVPEIPPMPDIVFLADTTGSMGGAVDNVRNNIEAIMNDVDASGANAYYGVADYKDAEHTGGGDPYDFNLGQALTDDPNLVVAAMALWDCDYYGGDVPEQQLNALYQLATDPAVGFRDGSTRIIVWMGDASGHDPAVGITEGMAITALQDSDIHVIAVPVVTDEGDGLDSTGQATNITTATDGVLLPGAAPEDVADAILEGLTALSTDVWATVEPEDGPLSVTFDPEVHYGVLSGTTVSFVETIEVPSDTEPGEYNYTVTFWSNSYPEEGSEIGTQSITIRIPLVEVDKHWSYTNVCFELDNDGDGAIGEDPENYDYQDLDGDGVLDDIDLDGNPDLLPVDDDGDGLFNEDPWECGEEGVDASLGTPLPQDEGGVYQLQAVVKKNGRVSSYNPGQFYAVSTVEVLHDVETLTITETFSACADIAELNPKKGGGKVVVVWMDGDVPVQILDAKDPEVTVDEIAGTATIELGDVSAGTYMVYVKFAPGLTDIDDNPEEPCVNYNGATASIGDYDYGDEATASIAVVE